MTEDKLIAAIETTIEAAAQACEPYYVQDAAPAAAAPPKAARVRAVTMR